MQFTSALNAHQLSDTELGLFSGAVLLSERPGLNDVKAVQRLQDRLLEALKVQALRNHTVSGEATSAGGCSGVSSVSQRIPELRALGARHANLLDWFRRNWTKLKLPPLFAEIFDIPKCEEDLQWRGDYIIFFALLWFAIQSDNVNDKNFNDKIAFEECFRVHRVNSTRTALPEEFF